MSLLNLVDVGKYFGARAVFEGVSFTLAAGEKVALVGRNGVGKTTLLKVIAGELEADAGSIFIARGTKIGFLTQDTEYSSDLPVYEEMRQVFQDVLVMRQKLDELEASMSTPQIHDYPERLEAVMTEYSSLQEEFERIGGYMVDTRIKSVVYGLGFTEDCMSRPVASFSGGERVRIRLGKLLLSEPNLLLLDEPTNHLDLRATEWLEEYIKTFPGAILVVSHDRYFLDMVSQKVVELERGHAVAYPGNYSAYTHIKEERLAVALVAKERQDAEAAKLQTFVDKWKAGTKSTLAKSREKALARMERIDVPKGPGKSAKIRFNESVRSGKDVVIVRDLWKSFNGRRLFKPFSAVIERENRVGIIGRNGAGKSTLLKMLVGQEEPSGGSLQLGHNVEVGYFSQGLDDLSNDRTILEEVESACDYLRERVRTILGSLLFTGEEVNKPIKVLSGGERNRVCLAKLLVGKHNLLVLDEPTNHLDISAKDALERALQEYNGTVLLVSHDRYFLDHIVDRVLDIDENEVSFYKGNYSEYREYKAQLKVRVQAEMAAKVKGVGQVKPGVAPVTVSGRPPRDNTERIRKRLLAKQSELEEKIAEEEQVLAQLEQELSNPELYNDPALSKNVVDEHNKSQERLAELYSEWEEVTQASEQS